MLFLVIEVFGHLCPDFFVSVIRLWHAGTPPARTGRTSPASGGNVDARLLENRIRDCHRQIAAQSERLARQAKLGQSPTQSRMVLLCLVRSLAELLKMRDEATDFGSKSPNLRVVG